MSQPPARYPKDPTDELVRLCQRDGIKVEVVDCGRAPLKKISLRAQMAEAGVPLVPKPAATHAPSLTTVQQPGFNNEISDAALADMPMPSPSAATSTIFARPPVILSQPSQTESHLRQQEPSGRNPWDDLCSDDAALCAALDDT